MKKKILIILAVIIGLVAIAAITCPEKKDHSDAIMNAIKGALAEQVEEEKSNFEDNSEFLYGLTGIAEGFMGQIFDKVLVVKNRFVYSEGFVPDGENMKKVSVGVFGHVFTVSKDDVRKMMDEAL